MIGGAIFPSVEYCNNGHFIKFALAQLGASRPISNIVCGVTEVQMIRSNAKCVVAFMQHKIVTAQFTEVKLKRKPMSPYLSGVDANSSVIRGYIHVPHPYPAA